jgi:restriction system protein
MALWLVRAGQHGEHEQAALQHGVVVIGWRDWKKLPDLSGIRTREELVQLLERTFPESAKTVPNWTGQIWAFLKKIQVGDLVVLPLKTQGAIAVGKVTGGYAYQTGLAPDVHHTRQVKWLKMDVPKTAFQQDLLYSFGANMTVCQISRNNAEDRVRAIVEGRPAPTSVAGEEAEELPPRDIEEVAHDQIITHINQQFKGHELARLVDAVLQAEGYLTRRSLPGADGGVDILASKGAFGFDAPRLVVQVKSGDTPLDVNVLRSLPLDRFRADHGLLVSLTGFNRKTLEEARDSFFKIRLWDSDTLLDAVLKNYERLPEDIRAELPLKRVWALVPPEEE